MYKRQVVDGTPMDNFTGGVDDVWGNSGADMGNGLSDINPEDIESMTVLKGASDVYKRQVVYGE